MKLDDQPNSFWGLYYVDSAATLDSESAVISFQLRFWSAIVLPWEAMNWSGGHGAITIGGSKPFRVGSPKCADGTSDSCYIHEWSRSYSRTGVIAQNITAKNVTLYASGIVNERTIRDTSRLTPTQSHVTARCQERERFSLTSENDHIGVRGRKRCWRSRCCRRKF